MDGTKLLVYGSYGYTGSLIARHAVEEGMEPILAGRSAKPVERQATNLDCEHRVFSLEYPAVVESELEDVDAVLNCAGPFSSTAEPLADACLEVGTDYLDVTGELDVIEALAERDRDAEKAGVTLLPGVGFDVVPTDCLAAHLESRLPSATQLSLGIEWDGRPSGGTVQSLVEGLSSPGAIREDGAIREVPAAWKTRRIDFGDGERTAATIPGADISSAYYTTGIPNIEMYAALPRPAIGLLRRTRPLAPLLGSKPVQTALKRLADAAVSGPTAERRARSACHIWGEAIDDEGERAVARLRTPDPYDVTTVTAVEAARRVVSDDVSPGFQTPASAFGAEFALSFDGIYREERIEGKTAITKEA